jgi:hypothetical protein
VDVTEIRQISLLQRARLLAGIEQAMRDVNDTITTLPGRPLRPARPPRRSGQRPSRRKPGTPARSGHHTTTDHEHDPAPPRRGRGRWRGITVRHGHGISRQFRADIITQDGTGGRVRGSGRGSEQRLAHAQIIAAVVLIMEIALACFLWGL